MHKQISLLLRTMLPLFALVLLTVAHASEPLKETLLWPNGAPGSEGKTSDENVRIADNGERALSNIHKPSITRYLPPADTATGCAVIVAPGGGRLSQVQATQSARRTAHLRRNGSWFWFADEQHPTRGQMDRTFRGMAGDRWISNEGPKACHVIARAEGPGRNDNETRSPVRATPFRA